MEIKKIFVAGAGLMGGGISQVCAQAGYDVVMRDLSDEIVEKGLENIRWSTRKLVEKGKVQGSIDEIMGRIEAVTDLSAARDVDFVFEAITEDLDAKRRLFAELDGICPARAILATNTSAIPITNIAAATQRAPKVVGTHFFSPVPIMRFRTRMMSSSPRYCSASLSIRSSREITMRKSLSSRGLLVSGGML